ncbi:MAG: hypothetical protein WC067_00780 [Candidatus Methanomethylophilaceae archaeon]
MSASRVHINGRAIGILSAMLGTVAVFCVFTAWVTIDPEGVTYTGWEIFRKGSAGFYEHDVPIYIMICGVAAAFLGISESLSKGPGRILGLLVITCGAVIMISPSVFYYDNFVRDLMYQWDWTKIVDTYEARSGIIITEITGIALAVLGAVQVQMHGKD